MTKAQFASRGTIRLRPIRAQTNAERAARQRGRYAVAKPQAREAAPARRIEVGPGRLFDLPVLARKRAAGGRGGAPFAAALYVVVLWPSLSR
jgi:hypothetical protein